MIVVLLEVCVVSCFGGVRVEIVVFRGGTGGAGGGKRWGGR